MPNAMLLYFFFSPKIWVNTTVKLCNIRDLSKIAGLNDAKNMIKRMMDMNNLPILDAALVNTQGHQRLH